MSDKPIARSLALVVFVSASVSAFCLGALTFTLVTGELPFGLIPHFIAPVKKKPARMATPRQTLESGPGASARLDEEFLKAFYTELSKEKEKIAEERKKLAASQKIAEEIKKEAFKMQEQMKQVQDKVNSLLVFMDKKEISNVQKMSLIISGLDSATASKMLMEYDDDMAARVLYFMNQKKSSEIIGQIMSQADQKQMLRMSVITKKMQRLSEEFEGGNNQ